MIKRRFLRVLQGLGVRLHEIQPARLVYPNDGPVAGYYHRHPDPVVPVYWLVDEIAPSVDQAIASHHCRYAAHADRPGPSVTSPFHRTTGSWSQARGTEAGPVDDLGPTEV